MGYESIKVTSVTPRVGALVEGITLAEHDNYPLLKTRLKGFRHCFGQPPDVRKAFAEAMGIAP